MKTTVSSKGQIVLPAEFRLMDRVEAGQEFDVERLDRGDYRVIRRSASGERGRYRLAARLSAERLLRAHRLWVDGCAVNRRNQRRIRVSLHGFAQTSQTPPWIPSFSANCDSAF
jgi:bifunctional DNA-binding transcriptional regulator/antitoxin component of YhaV-PrlF toxin-antitoxin module